MSIKAVLFDLDGTLLPMDNDIFVKEYFGGMSKRMADYGYEPQKFIKAIWTCVSAMAGNDGSVRNERAFWNTFCSIYGDKALEDAEKFEDYYKTDFQAVKSVSKPNEKAKEIIDTLKQKGIRIIVATNPMFPRIATESRIRWAGLEPDDFELITTYENSSFCKPNILYYKEILQKQKLSPEECLMVGNDVAEDMVAGDIGMSVFLLTDYLINKNNSDISDYNHGDFSKLVKFIEKL